MLSFNIFWYWIPVFNLTDTLVLKCFFADTYSLLTPQNPRLDLFFVVDQELRTIQPGSHLTKRKRAVQTIQRWTALAVQRTALTIQWWTPTTQPARRMRAPAPRMKAHSLKPHPSNLSSTLRNFRCRLCFEKWCFTSQIPNLLYLIVLLVRTFSLPPSAVFVREVEIFTFCIGGEYAPMLHFASFIQILLTDILLFPRSFRPDLLLL